MKRSILFLAYWGLDDVLTVATVLPNLKVLSEMEDVDRLVLVTMERNGRSLQTDLRHIAKLEHKPFFSANIKPYALNKLSDLMRINSHLDDIIRTGDITLIIARSSLSGTIACRLWSKHKIPFIVESYEPHSEYMYDSRVWSKWDPRYLFQKYWERQQRRKAAHLLPVSVNYYQFLQEQGVETSRLTVMPCIVDIQKFQFQMAAREERRQQMGVPESGIVGIYVGKFGDIYLDEEAFDIFAQAFEVFGERFHLTILSPQDKEGIELALKERSLPMDRCFVTSAPHTQVAEYLSAADFAFSTVRPSPSRKYCSPIKNAEYWACGLPIVIPPGVGDDSDIIEDEGVGAVISMNRASIEKGLKEVARMLSQQDKRTNVKRIEGLAKKYRSLQVVQEAYEKVIPGLNF